MRSTAIMARMASRPSRLQRKCACGHGSISHSYNRCPTCESAAHAHQLQAQHAEQPEATIASGADIPFKIGAPDDAFEHEADRVAQQVMMDARAPITAGTLIPALQRLPAPPSDTGPVPADVGKVLAASGRPLDAATRDFFDSRFGYDFSQVRVHSGSAAEQSARSLNANAYTVGRNVVFGAGRFAPDTHDGRTLLAHELAHVVQQSGNTGRDVRPSHDKGGLGPGATPMLIQRQPDSPPKTEPKEPSPKAAAPKAQPPVKTLKGEGVDLKDPVAAGTAAIIDEVLSRNQKLAPYIGDRIKGGFRIAEKGKFIQDSTDGNFDSAYRKAYNLDSSVNVSKDTRGFFDSRKSEIHLRPGAEFGTALHESLHRLASPQLYVAYLKTAQDVSTGLVEVLKEGVTAYFTDMVLKDEGLPNFNDAYRSKKAKAESLIAALGADGFDLLAKFNFKGAALVEIGEKLGFSRAQYTAARGDGVKEVLKRMEKAM